MARFWFTSAPLPGHLDWGGLLKTAQALIAQGHDVRWVSEPRIGGMVQAAGVPFVAIERSGWLWPQPPLPDPATIGAKEALRRRYQRALDTWLSEELIGPAVEGLCDLAGEIGAPDVIVTDPFLTAAALAAERLGVPLAVGGWPAGPAIQEEELIAVQRELGREASKRIVRLCAHLGLKGVNFGGGLALRVQSPHLHLSYFNDYWHQGESVEPQTQFVGGRAAAPQGDPPAWLAEIPGEQGLGLVTLGSTFTSDLEFFAWGADAAARNGLIPLVVIGRQPIAPEDKAALKANLPGGTRLLNWVDYDHVFPRLKVIVHHGGMGTTHAAIVHGIPQVIVPHAADQRGQARRARQAKVGLEISVEDMRQGQLSPAVQAVMTTPLVIEAVASLRDAFAGLGGPVRAASLLAEMAG
ncbi:MAG: glycosyltransferase family 1 protein [Chloroflexi bacterium]|nr:glycosyltransferase family 1 protein [Chloroflexota bacterium]